MSRIGQVLALLAVGAIGIALLMTGCSQSVDDSAEDSSVEPNEKPEVRGTTRELLLDELKPVQLENCRVRRFGGKADGGYLHCKNLLERVEVAYSYGIGGRDWWGCSISRNYDLTVHQYDCFDTEEPVCRGGSFHFQPECIGPSRETIDGRIFDSLTNQISKNGDDGANLVVKMDVEGSEWESLMSTSDAVLSNIQQLAIEFHLDLDAKNPRESEKRYLAVIKRLKAHFYVANLHFNNYSCIDGVEPFPAWAFEVLFVNKKVAKLAEGGGTPTVSHVLDAPNDPNRRDCQLSTDGTVTKTLPKKVTRHLKKINATRAALL